MTTEPQPSEEAGTEVAKASWLATDEDDYNSEEDPDFDINKPVEDDDAEGDSGDEDKEADNEDGIDRPRKRRKTSADDAAEGGTGVDDAGAPTPTERTQTTARRKTATSSKSRKARAEESDDSSDYSDDDVGGEGGLVKTRAQKLREKEEKKRPVAQGEVTVDVDALWAQLNAQIRPSNHPSQRQSEAKNQTASQQDHLGAESAVKHTGDAHSPSPITLPDENKITIRRTYKFAGEVITEEQVVPRSSAAAKLYLSSTDAADVQADNPNEGGASRPRGVSGVRTNENGEPLCRPLRRISRFDPNPPDAFRRNWGKGAGVVKQVVKPKPPPEATAPAATEAAPPAKKANVVEKSAFDWAEFIDHEGIQEELKTHSRAKEGFLDRMDFLQRVDQKREEERRQARMKAT